MFEVSSTLRRAIALSVVAIVGATFLPVAVAQTIDVSLNVHYTTPGNNLSGGTYELVARSSHQGIYGLDVYLRNVSAPTSGPLGPRGTVNENDPAGLSIFQSYVPAVGLIGVSVGQDPVFPNLLEGEEESIFYGIGTIADGEPTDSGLPYETLDNEMGIPWGVGHSNGDPAWNAAVLLAEGSLIAGVAPGFATSGYLGSGTVFTATGDEDTIGPFSGVTLGPANLFVREVLTGFLGDFNDDGFVDAADYTVWRNNLDDPTEADINNNGDGLNGVDEADYGIWTANYGNILPMPGGGGLASRGVPAPGPQSVPEPAAMLLLAGAAGVLFLRPQTRFLRHVRVS